MTSPQSLEQYLPHAQERYQKRLEHLRVQERCTGSQENCRNSPENGVYSREASPEEAPRKLHLFSPPEEERKKQVREEISRCEKTLTQLDKRYGFQYLHVLGEGYVQQMQESGAGTSAENRTDLQKEIVEIVVVSVERYLHQIADDLLRGYGINRGKYKALYVGRNKVSLKGLESRLRTPELRKEVQQELVQEASLYLFKKFNLFKPERSSISTWIAQSARGSMMNYALKNSILIISRRMWQKTQAKMYLDRMIFLRDTAKTIKYSKETVPASLQANAIYFSLQGDYIDIWDTLPSGDGGHQSTFEEVYLADEESPSPEEEKISLERKQFIQQVLETLTPREEAVIKKRFGFEDGTGQTLEEIGKEWGITREAIRRTEIKALGRLRHPSRARILRAVITGEEKEEERKEEKKEKTVIFP